MTTTERSWAMHLHVPTTDGVENYDTRDHRVRTWLRRALSEALAPAHAWPLYVHCTSGKDRTGVFVAALLRLLAVDDALIIEEYMLSDEVARPQIEQALAGLVGFEIEPTSQRALELRISQFDARA